jgi:hypothetical protein
MASSGAKRMPDDKVIDIKTRQPPLVSSDIMDAAVRLVRMVDARELVALCAILLHDLDDIPLVKGAPDTPEVRDALYEILDDAVADIDRLTDTYKNEAENDF